MDCKYIKYFLKNKILLNFINNDYLPNFNIGKKNISAMILPHAGSMYVKDIMDYIFSEIDIDLFDNILLITTNHNNNNNYQTSDKNDTFEHIESEHIITDDMFFGLEHSHQSVMPYLCKINKPIYLVSIGQFSEGLIVDLLKVINKTLIIGNTDLLHCGSNYKITCGDIHTINKNTIEKIIHHDMTFKSYEMCGSNAIKTFIKLIEYFNYMYSEHVYITSDMIEKNFDNSVGYVGMIFSNVNNLKFNKYLLNLPKKIINWIFESSFEEHSIHDIIYEFRKNKLNKLQLNINNIEGIFITIEKNNILRGCIGTFKLINNDLIETILNRTIMSAFYDNRFSKITYDEVKYLSYKINFLHKPFIVDIGDIFDILKVGTHGITIYFNDGLNATYLASVLYEHFNITQDNLRNKFDVLVNSLKDKAGSNSNINYIELYECHEYS